jgi:AcrR family transcriptional regulator
MPAAIDPTHILDCVLAVWREEGYARATTRKIATVAGISEITLFRRFGDKSAMFRAALELEAERFSVAAIQYQGDVRSDLARIVDAYAALLDRSAAIILDFALEAPRNPDLVPLRSVPLAAIGKVAMVIARYQAEGVLRAGPPPTLLLALLSPLIMTALLRRAQPGIASDIHPIDRVDAFLKGWAEPAGR